MTTMELKSFTFRVLNSDGTPFGTGCFTFTGGSGESGVHYTHGASPTTGTPLTAFWYRDPVVGVLDINTLLTLDFVDSADSRQFQFNAWNLPECRCGLVTNTATPEQPGAISAHRGAAEDASCQSRRLEWPAPAKPIIETIEEEGVIVPLVDLVVVIDSSTSMKDEATALDAVVSAAIDTAIAQGPSDLRVVYLGIEGTFGGTRFNQTVRRYLTDTCKVDEALLRARKRGTLAGGGGQEDCARTVEDISRHFNWREEARRALFLLGDESLDAGNQDGKQDQADIEAANVAIAVATAAGVRVHTYLGTSSVKEKVRKEIESEYARLARETGGQSFTSQDALHGFQKLLQQVISSSKSAPRIIVHPFCCCREYVEASRS